MSFLVARTLVPCYTYPVAASILETGRRYSLFGIFSVFNLHCYGKCDFLFHLQMAGQCDWPVINLWSKPPQTNGVETPGVAAPGVSLGHSLFGV